MVRAYFFDKSSYVNFNLRRSMYLYLYTYSIIRPLVTSAEKKEALIFKMILFIYNILLKKHNLHSSNGRPTDEGYRRPAVLRPPQPQVRLSPRLGRDMKLLAAYLLLVLGGNATPTAEDVTKVVTSVGGEVDEEQLNALLAVPDLLA